MLPDDNAKLQFVQATSSGLILVPTPVVVANGYSQNLFTWASYAFVGVADAQEQGSIYQVAIGNGFGNVMDRLKLPHQGQVPSQNVGSANGQQIEVSESAGIVVVPVEKPNGILILPFEKSE